MIGKLPDTVADRSICIEMRRKMPSERVHKCRGEAELHHLEEIARRCVRFASDAVPALRKVDPRILDDLNDRAADSWGPLLALADIAGGQWPMLAGDAASVFSGASPDGDSLKVELLRDVRIAFDERGYDRLASSELAEALAADPERPWAEFSRGKPMTVRQLARLLGPFGIAPGPIRFPDGKILRGYKVEDFADAFARYIVSSDPLHRHNQALARNVTDRASVTDEPFNGSLYPLQTSTGAGCDGVTGENPSPSREVDSSCDMERF